MLYNCLLFFFFKQKTAYEMRISDWSSDVCSSDLNPLSVITASKFDQVQKYLTLTGHVYSPGVYLMNKAAFDKLSDEDKKAFVEAARIGVKANRDRIDSDEKNDVADLRSKGMEVVETIDKAHFQAALEPIMADFTKQFGKDNLDRIRAAKRSEERRVGKESVSTCRSRWARDH